LKFQAVAEKTAKDTRGLLYFAAPGSVNFKNTRPDVNQRPTGIHKKSAHCQFSRDQKIMRPCKRGESHDQLVKGDSD